MRLSSLLSVAVLLVAAACGGDDKAPTISGRPPANNTDRDSGPIDRDASETDATTAGTGGTGGAGGTSGGGSGGTGGDGPAAGSGGTGGIPAPSDDGPLIEFTSPSAASDAQEDELVTTSDLTVRCKVSKRADHPEINRSSVAITLADPLDPTKTITPPVDALADGEHEAKFNLRELPNGMLTFHCSARDLAATPVSNSAELVTLLDLGPKIEFVTPMDAEQLALKTPVPISFRVTPQLVEDGDTEAVVSAVTLRVLNRNFDVEPSAGDPTLYQTSVDFDDTQLFDVAPETAEIEVTATDGRTPTAAVRTSKIDIKVDGDGPRIVVEQPTNGSIVRGEVTLQVTIIDDSDVITNTVRGNYGSLLNLTMWNRSGTSFSKKFDTRTLPSMLTQITLQISATDAVGNETTVDHSLKLDNFPPVLSLDPPLIREVREVPPDFFCSKAFDPVGDSAVNDLQTTGFSSYFRVLIEDRTGSTSGQMADYQAGVQTNSVEVFAQKDTSKPFLVDTGTDGKCDNIAFETLPVIDRPEKITLAAITPRANAWYPPDEAHGWDPDNLDAPYDPLVCGPDPAGQLIAPTRACLTSEMTRVVHGRVEGKPPAVYAKMPTNADTGECTGEFWQILPLVGEGWRCVAARARDTIGNVGVSAPLRVCFDDEDAGNGTPDCDPAHTGNIPTCTSDCTIGAEQLFIQDNDLYWLL